MNPVLHSSVKHDWRTPESFLLLVSKLSQINLDPCASSDPGEQFAIYNFTVKDDGILQSWNKIGGLVFVNPPYGDDLPTWIKKIILEYRETVDLPVRFEIVSLTPARPDTKWFRLAWEASSAFCFWSGRLTFVGAPDPAGFPSALFYWGRRPHRFCDIFTDHGIVGIP